MKNRKRMPPEPSSELSVASEDSEPMHAVERTPNVGLGREIQAKIGLQLRTLYNDIVSEGTPDRFVRLLGELEKKTEQKKSSEEGSK